MNHSQHCCENLTSRIPLTIMGFFFFFTGHSESITGVGFLDIRSHCLKDTSDVVPPVGSSHWGLHSVSFFVLIVHCRHQRFGWSRQPLWTTQLPTQWVPTVYSPRVKRQGWKVIIYLHPLLKISMRGGLHPLTHALVAGKETSCITLFLHFSYF